MKPAGRRVVNRAALYSMKPAGRSVVNRTSRCSMKPAGRRCFTFDTESKRVLPCVSMH